MLTFTNIQKGTLVLFLFSKKGGSSELKSKKDYEKIKVKTIAFSIRFLKALKDKHLRGQKMLKYIKYINSAKMQNLIFAFCYNINKPKEISF